MGLTLFCYQVNYHFHRRKINFKVFNFLSYQVLKVRENKYLKKQLFSHFLMTVSGYENHIHKIFKNANDVATVGATCKLISSQFNPPSQERLKLNLRSIPEIQILSRRQQLFNNNFCRHEVCLLPFASQITKSRRHLHWQLLNADVNFRG